MKPNQDVIAVLNKMLRAARKGEIKGILAVTIEPRRVVGQAVAGDIPKYDAIGALDVLKRDVMDGVERMKDHFPKEHEELLG